MHPHLHDLHERSSWFQSWRVGPAGESSATLTQETTLPLKQGSLALSSEISSLTTLERGRQKAVRLSSGWESSHVANS